MRTVAVISCIPLLIRRLTVRTCTFSESPLKFRGTSKTHLTRAKMRPSTADKEAKYIFYEIIAFPAGVQIILMKILALNLGERVTSAVTYSPMLPSLAGITLPRTHYTTRVRVIQTTTTTPYLRARR